MSGAPPTGRADRLRRASALLVATALTVLGWSAGAAACPVCFAADERSRASFFHTAILLSALPLVLFAGLAFWFWRELAQSAPELDVLGEPSPSGEHPRR